MENLTKPINLAQICFPVFKLGEKQPTTENGRVFYQSDYVLLDDASTKTNIRVIDDKNIDKSTLGLRRLRLKVDGEQLYPIGKAIYFLVDLVKLAKATSWFIDNTGLIFQHSKRTRVKLKCCKIKQVLPLNGLGAVIEVEGIPQRFKTIFKPKPEEIYAGVLILNAGYILYGFYTELQKDTWRKI